eukprot:639418-Rhodomonas_salina.1
MACGSFCSNVSTSRQPSEHSSNGTSQPWSQHLSLGARRMFPHTVSMDVAHTKDCLAERARSLMDISLRRGDGNAAVHPCLKPWFQVLSSDFCCDPSGVAT